MIRPALVPRVSSVSSSVFPLRFSALLKFSRFRMLRSFRIALGMLSPVPLSQALFTSSLPRIASVSFTAPLATNVLLSVSFRGRMYWISRAGVK